MNLRQWNHKYPGCFLRMDRQSLTVYVPNDTAKEQLRNLADYRLIRTDYYKGIQYGLLERKRI